MLFVLFNSNNRSNNSYRHFIEVVKIFYAFYHNNFLANKKIAKTRNTLFSVIALYLEVKLRGQPLTFSAHPR